MVRALLCRIRNSFQALRGLCHSPPDQTSWFQALDSTKWLHHMSGLLRASVRSATALQVSNYSCAGGQSDETRLPRPASLCLADSGLCFSVPLARLCFAAASHLI